MKPTVINIEHYDQIIGDDSATFIRGAAQRNMFLLLGPPTGSPDDPTLLVGNTQNHMQLLQLSQIPPKLDPKEQRAMYLQAKAKIEEQIKSFEFRVLAGGTCDETGNVKDWNVHTFKLLTPVEWQKPVRQMLRRTLTSQDDPSDPDITLS